MTYLDQVTSMPICKLEGKRAYLLRSELINPRRVRPLEEVLAHGIEGGSIRIVTPKARTESVETVSQGHRGGKITGQATAVAGRRRLSPVGGE